MPRGKKKIPTEIFPRAKMFLLEIEINLYILAARFFCNKKFILTAGKKMCQGKKPCDKTKIVLSLGEGEGGTPRDGFFISSDAVTYYEVNCGVFLLRQVKWHLTYKGQLQVSRFKAYRIKKCKFSSEKNLAP